MIHPEAVAIDVDRHPASAAIPVQRLFGQPAFPGARRSRHQTPERTPADGRHAQGDAALDDPAQDLRVGFGPQIAQESGLDRKRLDGVVIAVAPQVGLKVIIQGSASRGPADGCARGAGDLGGRARRDRQRACSITGKQKLERSALLWLVQREEHFKLLPLI
jgi:hypothetical protein